MSERDDLTEQAYHTPEVDTPQKRATKRTLTIDLDTGEWLSPGALQPGDGARVAASVLPGMSPELVELAWTRATLIQDSAEDMREAISDAGGGMDFLLGLQSKVERMWDRQVDPDDPEAVSAYIRDVVLCATDELHEVLGEVHWKPWKDKRGIKDRAKYREEMADVLHFILDLYLAAGLTGQDIVLDYMAKHHENLARFKSAEYRGS